MHIFQQAFVHAMMRCICNEERSRGTCLLQAISIVFFTDSWRPDSFYARIAANRQRGLHTLCLLDIKVKEPSFESLARGRKACTPLFQCRPLDSSIIYCVHAVSWIRREYLPQVPERWP